MLGLEARALTIHLGPWIGTVELNVLDVAGWRYDDPPLAPLLKPLQDFVLDLQIPTKVVFAGLQDGTRRRDCVAAALHLDGVEVRAIGDVIVGVELAPYHVSGLEVHELVSPGAHRLEIGRRVARFGT